MATVTPAKKVEPKKVPKVRKAPKAKSVPKESSEVKDLQAIRDRLVQPHSLPVFHEQVGEVAVDVSGGVCEVNGEALSVDQVADLRRVLDAAFVAVS